MKDAMRRRGMVMATLVFLGGVSIVRSQLPEGPDCSLLKTLEPVTLFFDFRQLGEPIAPSWEPWLPFPDRSERTELDFHDRLDLWSLPPVPLLSVGFHPLIADDGFVFSHLDRFASYASVTNHLRYTHEVPGFPDWWIAEFGELGINASRPGNAIMEAYLSHDVETIMRANRVLSENRVDPPLQARTARQIVAWLRELDYLTLLQLDRDFELSIWYWSPVYPEPRFYPEGEPIR